MATANSYLISFSKQILTTPLLFAILLLCSSGCGSGAGELERFSLSGEVTFDGTPVPSGTMTLEPDSSQGNQGPASHALIQDGKYTLPRERGIVGGPYIVKLSGYEPAGAGVDDLGKPLFENYEVQINLSETTSNQPFHITSRKN